MQHTLPARAVRRGSARAGRQGRQTVRTCARAHPGASSGAAAQVRFGARVRPSRPDTPRPPVHKSSTKGECETPSSPQSGTVPVKRHRGYGKKSKSLRVSQDNETGLRRLFVTCILQPRDAWRTYQTDLRSARAGSRAPQGIASTLRILAAWCDRVNLGLNMR